MKYATRMVLVPDTPASLEKARLKVKKQTNKVAKAIRIKDQAKVKKWHVNPAPPGVVPKTVTPVSTPEELSTSLPPIYQAKGRRLLNEMMNAGFTWTPMKELILPSTEVVDNSNMEHILKEALVRGRSARKPQGWETFISEISRSSVPLSLFTKKSTQEAFAGPPSSAWEIY